ncbi:MAG: HD domain-containing protein [Erysipelotrichaceae bacterium]|nr:HD domain-containing protein [Erysipelotrichaceae bacterium]
MRTEDRNTVIEQLMILQGKDNSGHGLDHVNRVLSLAQDFAAQLPDADKDIVELIALLHDADDYKLTGRHDGSLDNAERILSLIDITEEQKKSVLDGISCIGYSKRLTGITPQSLEAMIVSDADMCDASGITGILRAYQYNMKFNAPFFDPDVMPMDEIDVGFYKSDLTTAVNHLFEKILRLRKLMLTKPGEQEAQKRHQAVVGFLDAYFREQKVSDQWLDLLERYR